MAFSVFFAFSSGLKKPLRLPKGYLERFLTHVAHVESTLGIEVEVYNDDRRWPWRKMEEGMAKLSDKTLCELAEEHNSWVESLYKNMDDQKQFKGKKKGEYDLVTPEQAQEFWHALTMIEVPPERWTKEYYRSRMEEIYEVMRGRPRAGMTFDAKKPLTPEQCDAVLSLFSFLDTHDIRLAVPKGYDQLASSHDGEYEWCPRCGAIHTDEVRYEWDEDTDSDEVRRCPYCKQDMDD